MRVLLTGGQGFVGRYLQRELLSAGHQVVAPSSNELDVRDADVVSSAVATVRPDGVVHLAAIAHPLDASADPPLAFGIAVGGTANVIEAIRTASPEAQVLAISSAAVYGSRPDVPVSEDKPANPDSIYGMAKLASKSIALAGALRYGLRVTVVRPFNHSGPGQSSKFVLPALAERVLAASRPGGAPIRAGNLAVRRDFLDVRDVVRAYRLLLELSDGRADGRVVNVASGRSVAIRDLVDGLIALSGRDAEVVTDPGLVRPDDVAESRGDATLLTELTGWQPRVDVDTMVADAWADAMARSMAQA